MARKSARWCGNGSETAVEIFKRQKKREGSRRPVNQLKIIGDSKSDLSTFGRNRNLQKRVWFSHGSAEITPYPYPQNPGPENRGFTRTRYIP